MSCQWLTPTVVSHEYVSLSKTMASTMITSERFTSDAFSQTSPRQVSRSIWQHELRQLSLHVYRSESSDITARESNLWSLKLLSSLSIKLIILLLQERLWKGVAGMALVWGGRKDIHHCSVSQLIDPKGCHRWAYLHSVMRWEKHIIWHSFHISNTCCLFCVSRSSHMVPLQSWGFLTEPSEANSARCHSTKT